jgi:hypothetical protein
MLLCGMLCISTGVVAVTVYKWIDAQGITHYSDQPHPGAERIEVQSSQTYSAPAPVAQATSDPSSSAAPAYSLCEIARPMNEEVFLNPESVTARVRVQPDLRTGHRVVLALDGKRLEQNSNDGTFTIAPIYRGTHTVMAIVEDSQGITLCQTPNVAFHVRQPSVLAPNNPNNPNNPSRSTATP